MPEGRIPHADVLAIPIDSYVAVSLSKVPSEETDRYGNPKSYAWHPIVAWESVGTLEHCRAFAAEWDLEPCLICKITGRLEPIEEEASSSVAQSGQRGLFPTEAQ